MPARLISVIAAASVMLLASACQPNDTVAEGSSQPADGPVVAVSNNTFTPATIDVDAGDTVTWNWEQGTHNVVFDDGRESEVMSSGTWTATFDDSGTYAYECTLHEGMNGTVVVGGQS